MAGGIAGLILAILYRKDGPQPKKYEWEILTEEDIEEENMEKIDDFLDNMKRPKKRIRYFYEPRSKEEINHHDQENLSKES